MHTAPVFYTASLVEFCARRIPTGGGGRMIGEIDVLYWIRLVETLEEKERKELQGDAFRLVNAILYRTSKAVIA